MLSLKNLKISQKFNIIFIVIIGLSMALSFYFSKVFFENNLYLPSFYFYTLFFLIMALCLYFSLQKIIVLPLIHLASNIDKFKEKNIDIKIESNDEIDKISKEFNLLADLIKKNRINLEGIVRNRTIELELACEELKKLNLKIERKENFLENLFDSIPFPIFYKNEHFRYIRCNKAFENFVGRKRKDIYGKTVYDFSSSRLAALYHKQDVELFENQEIQQYESIIEDASGNTKSVIFNKAICKYGEKKLGIVGLITDISKHKND